MSVIVSRRVAFGMRPRTGNYAHVKRTIRDGIQFDSKKEADRYTALRLLEANGEIRAFRLKPLYRMEVNGVLICKYTPDFVYEECRKGVWTEVVEDVKGYPNERWPMKRKLFKALFGQVIRET